jgi:hypothetical protein
MKIMVQLVIESGDGPAIVTEAATLTREALTEATLGLSLAESKTILAGVQEAIVAQQAAAYLATLQTCPTCGTQRRCKGHHQIVVRSLFGTLRLDSPRFRRCACQPADTQAVAVRWRSAWWSGRHRNGATWKRSGQPSCLSAWPSIS